MLDMMAVLFILGALSALPLTHAHMQLMNPSPLRDPHANRANEPKDYDILKPLNADGSNFACKGYQWNTPWTTVATYEAGGTYPMQLEGSATHGGGSCQLSMSFDGGMEFKVIKSMEGGCPDQKNYTFTVPEQLGKELEGKRAQGLFAWTWFNKIGNREMYMNCAVIEVVPKGTHSKRLTAPQKKLGARDVARANVAAQSALASLPDLFVANLKAINNCVTTETTDVVFDAPGNDVAFADGKIRDAAASFGKHKCIGKGSKSAGTSSSSSSQPPSGPAPPGGSTSGNNGQWNKPQSSSGSSKCDNSDGQWHPECDGSQKAASGSTSAEAKPAQQATQQQPVQDIKTGKEPSAKVEQQLNAYLAGLYGGKVPSGKRDTVSVPRKHNSKHTALKPNPKAKDTPKKDQDTKLQQELADIAGNDGPFKIPYPGTNDRYTARTTKPKKSQTSIIESKLQNLEGLVSKLLRLVSQKKGGKVQARGLDVNATMITSTTAANAPAVSSEPNAFDMFLLYLSRLQTTVIECIRDFSGTTPVLASEATADGLRRRQMLIPDLTGAVGGEHGGVCDDFESDNGLDYDDLTPQPESLVANATNALQLAADESALRSAHSASQQPPKLPSTAPKTSSSPPEPDIATTFPYFLAPGPVEWPGPNHPGEGNLETMPVIVDDLGPESEEAVRKWFEELAAGELNGELMGGEDADGTDSIGM